MRNRFGSLILAAVLAGCSAGHGLSPIGSAGPGVGQPKVVQTGTVPINWVQFTWGSASTPNLQTMVTGPDKNIWYTDYSGSNLIKMTLAGVPKLFPLKNGASPFNPDGLTVGSDGKFYVAQLSGSAIDVVTTAGAQTIHTIPSGDTVTYGGLALGSDKAVWFAEGQHIGRITTGGAISEIPYPDGNTNNYYGSVAAGPDGDVWVTEFAANVIDDVDPVTNNITTYRVGCSLLGLIVASDGNLWSNCGSQLARITTNGTVTLFNNPFSTPTDNEDIIKGPDGNPWFAGSTLANVIGEFNPATNTWTYYYPPNGTGNDLAMTLGPDGNVWTLDTNRNVDVYIPNPLTVKPSTLTFTGTGQNQTITITEAGTTSWTAKSSNTKIVTVTAGSAANKYTVTSGAAGKAKITVSDAVGNSFVVAVTVQ